mmetsp:Transcript_8241/g.10145  ORF Transcript_8241/g.10145 Transcript_8241/m.10145 type:complete len:213 (-) Transcript_8241:491-1129(-)
MVQPPPRQIFNLPRVNIIKQRVNCEIAPKGIFFRGTNPHQLRNTRITRIFLRAQIHKINPKLTHFHRGRFQMLALLGIAKDGTNRHRRFATFREVQIEQIRKLAAEHVVERNVDIEGVGGGGKKNGGAFPAFGGVFREVRGFIDSRGEGARGGERGGLEEFVADPASGDAKRGRGGFVFRDLLEEGEQGLFFGGEGDVGECLRGVVECGARE